jgi:hypothetical protein
MAMKLPNSHKESHRLRRARPCVESLEGRAATSHAPVAAGLHALGHAVVGNFPGAHFAATHRGFRGHFPGANIVATRHGFAGRFPGATIIARPGHFFGQFPGFTINI